MLPEGVNPYSGQGGFDNDNYNEVSADYNRKPTKPCLAGEPRYEDRFIAGSRADFGPKRQQLVKGPVFFCKFGVVPCLYSGDAIRSFY